MDKKQALRQARADVLVGKDRREVFETYKAFVPKPMQLATVIVGVPDPELKRQYFIPNLILLILLILAAVLKFFSLFALVQEFGLAASFGLGLLGLIVPVLCAIGVARFEGQFYLILPIFCIAGFLQIINHYHDPISAAIDAAFILAILVLSLLIKKKVFPNFGLKGAKKDPQGNFLF